MYAEVVKRVEELCLELNAFELRVKFLDEVPQTPAEDNLRPMKKWTIDVGGNFWIV